MIILVGRSASAKTHAFALAVVSWDIVQTWRKVPLWLRGIKLKASKNGVVGKYWDGGSVVLVQFP